MARRSQGHIWKRGNIYWIKYSLRGARREESSRSGEWAVANKLLKQRLAEVQLGVEVSPAARKTSLEDLERMLLDDLSLKQRKVPQRQQQCMAHLRAFFKGTVIADIGFEQVLRYIRSREAKGAMPATIRLECGVLKRALRLAVQAGKLQAVPSLPGFDKIRNTRTGFFDPEQFEAVLEKLSGPLADVALFAYVTGWRKSEVLGLRWKDVDFTRGEVRLNPGETKNDRARVFPFAMSSRLQQLLDRRRAATSDVEKERGEIVPYVFHRAGKPVRDFSDAWKTACRLAGCPDRLFHDLRRTAVRNLIRAGVERQVAKKITGHLTDSVLERYNIISTTDLEDAVRRLEASSVTIG